MSFLEIEGGFRLSGAVVASGAKNAALPMMAAALLADGSVELANVPHLTDVSTMAGVLDGLGVCIQRQGDELRLEARDGRPVEAPPNLVGQMRASFCVLGPLLARRGRAVVPLPGGCQIGPRPVDLHLRGLAALGARLEIARGRVCATASRLRGADIDLSGPQGSTVTGTANLLSAAVLAQGTTWIRHAAREPEIVDLGRLLLAMGARIEGLGTSTLKIDGVERLHSARHRLIADRIEAMTLLLAAVITGGDVTISNAAREHLAASLAALRDLGAVVEDHGEGARVVAGQRKRPLAIVATPFPGIPTDLQAQWMAVLSLVEGQSEVRDTVFPQRLMHVEPLRKMGAQIRLVDDHATIDGVSALHGEAVTACDLRASAALVLAGLAAHGTTEVHGLDHLDRGYENLDLKLRSLGARIVRWT